MEELKFIMIQMLALQKRWQLELQTCQQKFFGIVT